MCVSYIILYYLIKEVFAEQIESDQFDYKHGEIGL